MNADERKMPDALRREYDEVMRRMWGAWLRRSGREGGQGATFRLHKLLMQAVKDAKGPLDPASIDLISRVLRVLKGQLGTESVILLPDMVAASPASQELGQSLEKAERAVGSPDGESSGGEKNTSDSPAIQKLAQALGSRAKPAVASGDRDDSREKPTGFEAQLGTESVILLPDMVAASPASQELGQSLEKAERAVGSPDGESSGGEKNTSDSPAIQKLAQALGSRAKPAVASGDRDDSRDKPIGFEALFKNIAHLAKTPVGAYIVTQLVKKIGDSILASGESIFASLARQPAA